MKTDLSYYEKNSMFTVFLPNTQSGVMLWNAMHAIEADVVLTFHVPGVLQQIKDAGYTVSRMRKPKIGSIAEEEKLLLDLELCIH